MASRSLRTTGECGTGATFWPRMPEPLVLDRDVYLGWWPTATTACRSRRAGCSAADPATGKVVVCYPTDNERPRPASTRSTPATMLRADRDAEERGLQLAGVFHSHTHTEAYPSPTDVAQAPDPEWHYVLVGLRDGAGGALLPDRRREHHRGAVVLRE